MYDPSNHVFYTVYLSRPNDDGKELYHVRSVNTVTGKITDM